MHIKNLVDEHKDPVAMLAGSCKLWRLDKSLICRPGDIWMRAVLPCAQIRGLAEKHSSSHT
jgi:hypothetical protein